MKLTKIKKTKERIKNNAEVFTPDSLVNDMLNKLPKENWEEGKTFCDPACGNGQFLVHVLKRKLQLGHKPLEALKTIFGVDIMQDNIRECRQRLLATIQKHEEIKYDHVYTVFRNIVWINSKRYPGGSLDYDFSFSNGIKKRDVERWLEQIEDGLLEECSDNLPVIESKNETEWDVKNDDFEELFN